MPTYEYICSACNHAFERFESITSKPNKECEKCGKKKAERQISAGAGLIFKGTGFYVTDYKGAGKPDAKSKTATESKPAESKPAAESSSTPAASTPAPAPAAKSESKPAAKSSSKKK